jgi:hypothetical protein
MHTSYRVLWQVEYTLRKMHPFLARIAVRARRELQKTGRSVGGDIIPDSTHPVYEDEIRTLKRSLGLIQEHMSRTEPLSANTEENEEMWDTIRNDKLTGLSTWAQGSDTGTTQPELLQALEFLKEMETTLNHIYLKGIELNLFHSPSQMKQNHEVITVVFPP